MNGFFFVKRCCKINNVHVTTAFDKRNCKWRDNIHAIEIAYNEKKKWIL